MAGEQASGFALYAPRKSAKPIAEEVLVADSRAGMTPSQMVERKLVDLLKSNPLLVSQARLRAPSLRRAR